MEKSGVPKFLSWIGATLKIKEGTEVEVKFPQDVNDMDDVLGVNGRSIPDGKKYPGRNKKVLDLKDGWQVTHEGHPYHGDCPDYHKNPHWHVNTPDGKHKRYQSGSKVPKDVFKHIPK